MKTTFKRVLGRSGIEVSPMGMGCWAIGGPLTMQGMNLGWGNVDDAESKRALQKAFEMGVNFFDTADVYGGGHSEKLIGEVLSKHREKIVIATKFGMSFEGRAATGMDGSPAYLQKAIEASLKRLKTDYIDLYQFHLGDFPHEEALKTRDALETLVESGKIRGYAWSTDKPENAALFAEGPNCIAIQQEFNVFLGNMEIIKLCEEKNLASLNRGPLAMGILTGKFKENTLLPEDDCRFTVDQHGDPYYLFFRGGKAIPELLEKLDAITEILQSKGRSLAQGALAWIWAKSVVTIPIPGFKTVKQVEENAGAIEYGPLSPDQMGEIEKIFDSLK
jgi:aryl-alcohol dehydrogenase-like predicted oxidoreductase